MARRATAPALRAVEVDRVEIAEHFLDVGIKADGRLPMAQRAKAYLRFLKAAGFKGNVDLGCAGFVTGPGAENAVKWIRNIIFNMRRGDRQSEIAYLVGALEARRT